MKDSSLAHASADSYRSVCAQPSDPSRPLQGRAPTKTTHTPRQHVDASLPPPPTTHYCL